MNIKLLFEHHLERLSLKGGFTGSSESTLVKMAHCWKSHVTGHIIDRFFFINAGLTETYMERTIPEVLYTNSDGFLPDIEIKTDGNSSLITFQICQKLSVDEPVFPTNLSLPYIVLALDMVSFLSKLRVGIIKCMYF